VRKLPRQGGTLRGHSAIRIRLAGTGGACTKFGAAGTGSCKEVGDCKWQGSTIFHPIARLTIWPGPYPYKTGAVDKTVKDAESAFIHEFYVHLFPALSAALQPLKKFEADKFDSKDACNTAMAKALADARRTFVREAKKNPL
jgi:hypothetical protein